MSTFLLGLKIVNEAFYDLISNKFFENTCNALLCKLMLFFL
jgi:hypothetical protein